MTRKMARKMTPKRMKRTRTNRAMRWLVAASACAALGTPGLAGALTIQSVDRLVEAYSTSFCPGCGPNGEDEIYIDGDGIPSSARGVFEERVSSAGSYSSQNTTVDAAGISGYGVIEIGYTSDNRAENSLRVQFTVPTATSYRLDGDVGAGDYLSAAFVEFGSNVDGQLLRRSAHYGGNELFDQTFELLPGRTYTLEAKLVGFDYDAYPVVAHWSFDFLAVPEPGTGALFGAGLLAAAVSRRRRSADA